MNIVEAVEQALQTGKWIRRQSKPDLIVAATNGCCTPLRVYGDTQGNRYWAPTRDDLLADDWKLGE